MKRFLLPAICILLISSYAAAQDIPRVEVFGGYSMMRLGGEDIGFDYWEQGNDEEETSVSTSRWLKKGFMASAAFNINEYFGIEGNFQYNTGTVMEFTATGDVEGYPISMAGGADISNFTFMGGPRFTIRKNEAVTPFAHFLVGLSRINMTPSMTCTVDGEACPEEYIEYMYNEAHIADFSDTGFGFMFGGGIDVNASDSVAIRLIQVDYIKAYHTVNIPELDPEDAGFDLSNLNLAFGVVFKLGQ
ncbi:MAG: outer membrane beta-barrel protein [Acidobacteria bacterium]|nr:outer membrane beta-barrel protein [Acidobacteriota bacterium]